jgi:hypothetical protein
MYVEDTNYIIFYRDHNYASYDSYSQTGMFYLILILLVASCNQLNYIGQIDLACATEATHITFI